jgi:VWFA-related protein
MRTFALIAAIAAAQTLTQKIDVSVVNVDVVVTAKDGSPVHGLTRDDFQVFEDGVMQPITNFYAVEAGAPAPALSAVEGSTPPPPPPDSRFRRKVLVLIDNEHLSKYYRNAALEKLEQFINDSFRAGDYDWSIATVGARLGMIMPLNSDKQRIHATLVAVRAGAAHDQDRSPTIDSRPTEVQTAPLSAMNRDRGMATDFAHNSDDRERAIRAKFATEALVEAARAFGATGGKKIILLLTDNSDLNDLELSYATHVAVVQRDLLSPRTTQDLPGTARDINQLRDRIIAEANASNVSLYVIDPEGLRAPGDIALANPSGTQGMTRHNAVVWIADQTGGRLFPGNNVDASIAQFDTSSSNFYSLGFRPAHDDGKYHKLVVKLKRPGDYKVQHRAGYSNVPADLQLERTLKSPITIASDNATLPVTLMTETAQPQRRGEVLVPFQAKIPVSKLQFLPAGEKWSARLDIYVSVFDENGKNITLNHVTTSATGDSANPDPSGTFTYRNGILIRRGQQHRLVVAFRDQSTGAVGVAESVVRSE